MRNILITIKKELRSIFRDKKAMIAMFIYPLLIPVMVILYGNIGEIEDAETTATIGINYELNETEESLFKNLNITTIEYNSKDDLDKAFKNNEIESYIIKNDNNNYTVYTDESSATNLTSASLVYEYFEEYNSLLAANYIEDKGISSEEAFNQLTYNVESLKSNNYMTTVLISVTLTYTILAICIAEVNVAISTTATEKENGTLETILTLPITKQELIVGKSLSTIIVGFLAGLISYILMIISMIIGIKNYSIFADTKLNLSLASVSGCVITCLLAAIFIGGIAMLLTSFAKSYKEAQSKTSLITLLGMVPMFISILDIKINKLYYLIPICNYVQIIEDFLSGDINPINLLIVLVSTIIYIYIIIKLIIKLYNSEDILFNN